MSRKCSGGLSGARARTLARTHVAVLGCGGFGRFGGGIPVGGVAVVAAAAVVRATPRTSRSAKLVHGKGRGKAMLKFPVRFLEVDMERARVAAPPPRG